MADDIPDQAVDTTSAAVDKAVDDGEGSAEGPTEPVSRKTSTGSGDILLSQIKVIVKHHSDSEEEASEEEVEKKPKKKTVKKKKKKGGAGKNKEVPASPAEILTKTLAQAMRLINEQKEKERQKQKKEEIRRLALQQKERKEGMSNPRVILHC